MKHPLKKYCEKTGVSLKDLAAKADTSPDYLSQLIGEIRWPGWKLSEKLEKATDGMVKKEDLVWFNRKAS